MSFYLFKLSDELFQRRLCQPLFHKGLGFFQFRLQDPLDIPPDGAIDIGIFVYPK